MKEDDRVLLELAKQEIYFSEVLQDLLAAFKRFAASRNVVDFIEGLRQWLEIVEAQKSFVCFKNRKEFEAYCRKLNIEFRSHYSIPGGGETYIDFNWRLFEESSKAFVALGITTTYAFIHDGLERQSLKLIDIEQLERFVAGDYKKVAQLFGDCFEYSAKTLETKVELRGYYLQALEMLALMRGIN